eukprot:GHVT01066447.1.p1 GENE.GHVT01066447.1~~GHVT01066447.1.p1  ORF type:complete len:108 (-),score=17.71 GHVT01066447.1:184-507(-)
MFPSFPLGATPRPDQRPASSFPGGIAWAAALCTRASVACWRKSVWKRRTNGQQSNAKTPEGREKEQTSNQTLSEAVVYVHHVHLAVATPTYASIIARAPRLETDKIE